ncbi:MAG: hypothetical protein MHM6MM_001559 [Cercozoa sp. M6MM]
MLPLVNAPKWTCRPTDDASAMVERWRPAIRHHTFCHWAVAILLLASTLLVYAWHFDPILESFDPKLVAIDPTQRNHIVSRKVDSAPAAAYLQQFGALGHAPADGHGESPWLHFARTRLDLPHDIKAWLDFAWAPLYLPYDNGTVDLASLLGGSGRIHFLHQGGKRPQIADTSRFDLAQVRIPSAYAHHVLALRSDHKSLLVCGVETNPTFHAGVCTMFAVARSLCLHFVDPSKCDFHEVTAIAAFGEKEFLLHYCPDRTDALVADMLHAVARMLHARWEQMTDAERSALYIATRLHMSDGLIPTLLVILDCVLVAVCRPLALVVLFVGCLLPSIEERIFYPGMRAAERLLPVIRTLTVTSNRWSAGVLAIITWASLQQVAEISGQLLTRVDASIRLADGSTRDTIRMTTQVDTYVASAVASAVAIASTLLSAAPPKNYNAASMMRSVGRRSLLWRSVLCSLSDATVASLFATHLVLALHPYTYLGL